MPGTRPIAPVGLRPIARRAGFLLALSVALAGCGSPAPAPAPDGRSPYSYDDDEIDPANLPPPGSRAGSPGS